MQMFGEEANSPDVTPVGNQQIETKKASELAIGTHSVRFWPLSAEYYNGADYPVIVQSAHWFNRVPTICRRTSYDYTVPETQNKPKIDNSCVVCTDKFSFYKKAKDLKESDSKESDRLKKLGKDLQENTLGASIISFVGSTGELTPPILLRYGIELLTQIEHSAQRIWTSSSVNICDPVKGYLFDIIISTKSKKEGGYRTYKHSVPTEGPNGRVHVDITNLSWKWNEICEAIKSEIKAIPTPEEVKKIYINYLNGVSSQNFLHPELSDNSGTPAQGNTQPNSYNSVLGTGNVAKESVKEDAPPVSEDKVTATPPITDPPLAIDTTSPEKLFPCHSKVPNGSGYDAQDENCKSCAQNKSCYDGSVPFTQNTKVKPGASNSVNAEVEGNFDVSDITNRLAVLSDKIFEDKG